MSLLLAYNPIFTGIKQSRALTTAASKAVLGKLTADMWREYFTAVADIMFIVRERAIKFETQLIELLDEGRQSLEYETFLEEVKQVYALSEVGSTIDFDLFNEELLRDYFAAFANIMLRVKDKADVLGDELLKLATPEEK
jgi:hypothetical protein